MARDKSSTSSEDKVPNLLRIIIRLLIEGQIPADKMIMNDGITMLDSIDGAPTEIGQIIGWSTNSVTGKPASMKKAKEK